MGNPAKLESEQVKEVRDFDAGQEDNKSDDQVSEYEEVDQNEMSSQNSVKSQDGQDELSSDHTEDYMDTEFNMSKRELLFVFDLIDVNKNERITADDFRQYV